MARLPDTGGMPSEESWCAANAISMTTACVPRARRSSRWGLPDRYAGAGVRDAEVWEIEDAISERDGGDLLRGRRRRTTAAEKHLQAGAPAQDPVIVDAAAQAAAAIQSQALRPRGRRPRDILRRKGAGRPQASGILCGRRDLIMAGEPSASRSRRLLGHVGGRRPLRSSTSAG